MRCGGGVRNNGGVATPELAPPRTFGGIVAVWVTAAVAGIAIGLFVPPGWRAAWLIVALGGCFLLAFAIQLASGRARGFSERVAASALGALVIMGIISLGFGLATMLPG